MDRYILKSSADVTAYHNLSDWQTTSCAPVSINQAIMNPPQHRASGAEDFGIEYFRKEHALHLLKTLEVDYKITTDWEGTKFSGIDLPCDYHAQHVNQTCHISMKGYIAKVLLKYGHPIPNKPQLSPHKHRELIYGAKYQLAPEDDTSPPLDIQGTNGVQGIVGALLYYV